MMRVLAFIAIILVCSGCICCGGGLGSKSSGSSTGDVVCDPPNIRVGTDCCLDANYNKICDRDEEGGQPQQTEQWESTTTIEQAVTTSTQAGTTVAPGDLPTTSSPGPTETTPPITTTTLSKTYACVKESGYDPESVFFLYSSHCGESDISTASNVEGKTGVKFTKMKIGGSFYTDEKIRVLECFFGKYSDTNLEFTYCPRLLCPKTAEVKTPQASGGSMSSQMSGFANKCK